MTTIAAPSAPTKNDWLQALRALAALAVLFHHLTGHWAIVPWLKPMTSWMNWGFAGVDVFFVLSGFVVYQSADRYPLNWRAFLMRRGLRIYLGYWPVLALMVLTALFTHEWPDGSTLWRSVLLLEPDHRANWVPTAWSLTFELYFYVWIALICVAPPRWRLSALLGAMATLLAWNLGWLLLAPEAVRAGQQPLSFLFAGFGLEFLTGSLLAHARKRHPGLHRDGARYLGLGLGALLVPTGLWIAYVFPQSFFLIVPRIFSFGITGFGLLLVALALNDLRWKAPATWVAIGDASYSLYLIHVVLIGWSVHARLKYLPPDGWALAIYLLVLPLLIVLLALLWYRWIERPLFERAARSGVLRRLSGLSEGSPATHVVG